VSCALQLQSLEAFRGVGSVDALENRADLRRGSPGGGQPACQFRTDLGADVAWSPGLCTLLLVLPPTFSGDLVLELLGAGLHLAPDLLAEADDLADHPVDDLHDRFGE